MSNCGSPPDTTRDEVSGVKVYCFENFINTGYIWRFRLPNNAFDALIDSMDTVKIPKLDPSDEFWKQRPRWWDPDPHVDAEFTSWIDGKIGADLVTMYDKTNKVLYGRSYFDF